MSANVPARRPRSRSVTKAGPPTAPNTRLLPPKRRVRAGLRAWRSNSAGAPEMSASSWAGSSLTRRLCRSTIAPAASKASSARSPRTSTPISDRIRSDAWWIASTWSADRISTGRNGLTSVRHGRRAKPGAARRGRRRGPSEGWAAAGAGSGVTSTTGCYAPDRPSVGAGARAGSAEQAILSVISETGR